MRPWRRLIFKLYSQDETVLQRYSTGSFADNGPINISRLIQYSWREFWVKSPPGSAYFNKQAVKSKSAHVCECRTREPVWHRARAITTLFPSQFVSTLCPSSSQKPGCCVPLPRFKHIPHNILSCCVLCTTDVIGLELLSNSTAWSSKHVAAITAWGHEVAFEHLEPWLPFAMPWFVSYGEDLVILWIHPSWLQVAFASTYPLSANH